MANLGLVEKYLNDIVEILKGNPIDQDYITNIIRDLSYKGKSNYKEFTIYWSNRFHVTVNVSQLHRVSCQKDCVYVYGKDHFIVIPYRNIDYIKVK